MRIAAAAIHLPHCHCLPLALEGGMWRRTRNDGV
jgi:hypothetical protein